MRVVVLGAGRAASVAHIARRFLSGARKKRSRAKNLEDSTPPTGILQSGRARAATGTAAPSIPGPAATATAATATAATATAVAGPATTTAAAAGATTSNPTSMAAEPAIRPLVDTRIDLQDTVRNTQIQS